MANRDEFQKRRRDSAHRRLHRNPLANWRWWAALPLTLAIAGLAGLAGLCAAVKTLGDIAGCFDEWIDGSLVRPLIRRTWGNDDKGETHDE